MASTSCLRRFCTCVYVWSGDRRYYALACPMPITCKFRSSPISLMSRPFFHCCMHVTAIQWWYRPAARKRKLSKSYLSPFSRLRRGSATTQAHGHRQSSILISFSYTPFTFDNHRGSHPPAHTMSMIPSLPDIDPPPPEDASRCQLLGPTALIVQGLSAFNAPWPS